MIDQKQMELLKNRLNVARFILFNKFKPLIE